MYNITFKPFVGNNYHLQSPKFLILGESHYDGEGADNEDFTCMVVKKYAQQENGEKRKFFTIIAKNVDNELDNNTAKSLWGKVAFYNYVQTIVGSGPRQRPSIEMFDMSRQAFKTVVESLKPDIIVILGRHLGNHLIQHKDYFAFSDSKPILCYWSHPSSPMYFKNSDAQLEIQKAKEQFAMSRAA